MKINMFRTAVDKYLFDGANQDVSYVFLQIKMKPQKIGITTNKDIQYLQINTQT